jgi:transcriptional regulator with XRE-family HTH domain
VEARRRFGENLRRQRHRRKLTQEGLAEACGLHPTEVSLLERGGRDPRLATIVKLAHGLGVAPAKLLDGIG